MTSPLDPVAERRRELERRLAALSPEARASIECAWENPTADAPVQSSPSSAIPPLDRNEPLALSFAQELLWLLEENNPGHLYNVPRAIRLEGALDFAALQLALNALVERHEILRTTYGAVDGEPRQYVNPPQAVPIDRLDLGSLPETEREATAIVEVQARSRRVFDLSRDLQLRATVISLSGSEQVLLLESHHIASDAWSGNILLRELGALYGGFRTGTAVSLPPLTVQYADFAAWQRLRLSGESLERLLDFWRGQLAGIPPLLDLPTDRPRSEADSYEGNVLGITLPFPLLESLRRLSQREGTTLFMTLLAAFDVLLARLSGQDDIVVGSPMAGRSHDETAGIIGYFVNMLVLRTSVEGNPPFRELLRRVREAVLGAYDHQELPFEKLVMELSREKVIGNATPFQVMFTLQDPERETLEMDGVKRVAFGAQRGGAKFDLSLVVQERVDGLRLAVEYRTNLFDESTVERMLRQLTVILEAVAADVDTPIGALPLMDAAERRRVLALGDGPEEPRGDHPTLGEMLVAQAARTPTGIAVEFVDSRGELGQLTYLDLMERATHLAERLRKGGAGRGVGVAICAARSPELVVAMVAVLLSGGYYVPLDPEYPAERVAYMLADASPAVLLTSTDLLQLLWPTGLPTPGPCLILLDAEAPAAGTGEAETSAPGPEDLAYVIYTSGSTGQPKGVMIPNRAVVNYLAWMQRVYPLSSVDKVLQKAPASFDACIWEFFLPLTTGATLVLALPGGQQDPSYLLEAIQRHGLTVMQLVPSQLAMLFEYSVSEATTALSRLQHLFLGGEALPGDLLARLRSACPTLPITNLYGPTETTVYSAHWDCPTGDWSGLDVPIGRAIDNTRIRLLDADLRVVPEGVAGELCIAGEGVAKGYLGRPELTADRFVQDPFRDSREARIYRTGDRARWLSNGTLQYLGRLDGQIKLRGYRIELGEVEQAIAGGQGVQSVVAMVREDAPGDRRLVAYCVASAEGPTDPEAEAVWSAAIRERLHRAMPGFMVPSTVVWLESMPLNANGKLDRRALPVPGATVGVTGPAYAPPTTGMQQLLTKVVEEVLMRSPVGIQDNFFDLGGHSLLAMRVLSRIAAQTGTRIPLRRFFDAPTLGDVAAAFDAAAGTVEAGVPRITAASRSAYRRSPSGGS